MIIIRHFLVDSENVNDNWLMLFDMADEDDEIVVFYTKKSPHMSYMSVIRLMENNKITDLRNPMRARMPLIFSWYHIWDI